MWRRASALPVLLLLVSASWGWLYLLRPALPGPLVPDALPLDELAKHASAPLVWYLAVWALAALLVGLHARWARIEPLTAALCLAATAGIWTYLANAVSIAVTRQVSMRDALDVAARLESTYLGPALVAVAAALLATDRGRAVRRTPVLVAGLVAAGASLDLLHTMLPGDDSGLLHNLTPDAAGPLARAAGALAGIVLLFAARGLARRRRRAWQIAMVVAGVSAGLHVLSSVPARGVRAG